jgi:hypothetical protein
MCGAYASCVTSGIDGRLSVNDLEGLLFHPHMWTANIQSHSAKFSRLSVSVVNRKESNIRHLRLQYFFVSSNSVK